MAIDWSCRYFLKSAALNKVWCRIMGHYVDWTSHIPELAKMDSEDQLQLMLARSIPCVWMLVGQRSMSKNNHGISLSGGAYFPTDEEEQKQIDKEILPFLKKVCTWVKEEYMEPAKAMDLSETEYAILRVLCFFVPVAKLSPKGKDIVRRARHFYRNVLIQHLRSKYPGQEDFCMSRLAELLCFLPIMEIAGRMEDDELSFMTLFNVADMQGTLTYEVHVRKSQ
uniref:NR LBD domain-containing protein n=1 Tax=Panagrolaimus davidi TaxID=227884 RepID=A0A914Q4B2_9BILA